MKSMRSDADASLLSTRFGPAAQIGIASEKPHAWLSPRGACCRRHRGKYENYLKNLRVLRTSDQQDLSNEFVVSGVIDKFSLQFELGWKVMKELLRYEGVSVAATGSPREIIKAAWRLYDFMDQETWLRMLRERNNSTHVYDGNAAKELANRILEEYIPEFNRFQEGIIDWYGEDFLLKRD